jgi:dsRNA-specific ribonuclease
MKNIALKIKTSTALMLAFCLFMLAFGDAVAQKPQLYEDNLQAGDSVEIETLNKIAKKYGFDDGLKITPKSNSSKVPSKVKLKVSLKDFEAMIARMSIDHNRGKITNKFFKEEYPNIKSAKDYIALRRVYQKKYAQYLKDAPFFQEKAIVADEKNADKIVLNNRYFNTQKKL